MGTAKTLLQLAGAAPQPSCFGESALVFIDAQNDYRRRLPLDGIDAAIARAAHALARARAAGIPVFHVLQRGSPGGLFDLDALGGAVVPELTPIDGEAVVVKTLPSAFAATDLHERLRSTGRTRLIVAGFMTHMCVSTTVRAAIDLGYWSTVVADATATRALPDPLGGVDLTAEEVQRAALSALADRFAVVVPLDAIPD